MRPWGDREVVDREVRHPPVADPLVQGVAGGVGEVREEQDLSAARLTSAVTAPA
jgi:hypothetical protein